MGRLPRQTVEVPLLTGIDEWSVDDVVSLFKKCKFTSAADVIEENQVDGKTLCDLSDVDLYSNVEEGGLGLKPLQMKRIRCELSRSSATTASAASTTTASSDALSLGFQSSESPDADVSQRPKDEGTEPLNSANHTQTIYSAQSSGEYNLPAIHYSIDFEGWLNGRLHKMFQATCPDVSWEISAVDDLLACDVEDAVKFVALYIREKRSQQPGINILQHPNEWLPSQEWFDELHEQIVKFQENCREALLDDKILASKASLDSSFRRRYQEGQLRLNRAKAQARPANANRRMSDPKRSSSKSR